MRRGHTKARLPAAIAPLLAAGLLAGWATAATNGPTLGLTRHVIWTLSERGAKTELIRHLESPPELIVLGGSRALRFSRATSAAAPA